MKGKPLYSGLTPQQRAELREDIQDSIVEIRYARGDRDESRARDRLLAVLKRRSALQRASRAQLSFLAPAGKWISPRPLRLKKTRAKRNR